MPKVEMWLSIPYKKKRTPYYYMVGLNYFMVCLIWNIFGCEVIKIPNLDIAFVKTYIFVTEI